LDTKQINRRPRPRGGQCLHREVQPTTVGGQRIAKITDGRMHMKDAELCGACKAYWAGGRHSGGPASSRRGLGEHGSLRCEDPTRVCPAIQDFPGHGLDQRSWPKAEQRRLALVCRIDMAADRR
jgi:hypothetical protein